MNSKHQRSSFLKIALSLICTTAIPLLVQAQTNVKKTASLVEPKVDSPGDRFVPFAGIESRVDDEAILNAAIDHYEELLEDKSIVWPKFRFRKIPKYSSEEIEFSASKQKPTVEDLAKATLILVGGGEEMGTAGAVLISADGLAVTNRHVASMARKNLIAMTSQGTFHRVIDILAADKNKDVALIRLEGKSFPFVPVADSPPAAGDDIVMLHHSENRFYTYDRGYVRRNSRIGDVTRMEISADYAPGGSGCGIFNANHELVGLVCEIATGDGPMLASGHDGFGFDLGEDFSDKQSEEHLGEDYSMLVVKHAVHHSSLVSLWNPQPQPVKKTEIQNEKLAKAKTEKKKDKATFVFESDVFDAPVSLQAGAKPMTTNSGYSSPAIFDIDNDGQDEMVLGSISGELTFCENKDAAKNGTQKGDPVWSKPKLAKTADGDDLVFDNW